MSVDKIQGTEAEKNRIDEIDTTPTTNFDANAPSAISNAGENISAKPVADALATIIGSGS